MDNLHQKIQQSDKLTRREFVIGIAGLIGGIACLKSQKPDYTTKRSIDIIMPTWLPEQSYPEVGHIVDSYVSDLEWGLDDKINVNGLWLRIRDELGYFIFNGQTVAGVSSPASMNTSVVWRKGIQDGPAIYDILPAFTHELGHLYLYQKGLPDNNEDWSAYSDLEYAISYAKELSPTFLGKLRR